MKKIIVGALLLAGMQSANAIPVTWVAFGKIGGVDDSTGLLGLNADAGDHFRAAYTFDTDALGTCPSPEWCTYFGALTGFEISIKNQRVDVPATPATGQISVEANAPHSSNTYATTYSANVFAQGFTPGFVGVSRGAQVVLTNVSTDPLLGPFSSPAMPLTPPNPGDFLGNNFSYAATSYNGKSATASSVLWGHIDKIIRVPLPGTVWLFGIGLLGLLGMTRKKAA